MPEEVTGEYVWIDSDGRRTSLMNNSEYVVLREGIRGFSGVSNDRSLIQLPSEYAEYANSRTSHAREFGFSVSIIGTSHDDIMAKRAKLLKMFSMPGTLAKRRNGSEVYIDCYAARGSPSIQNGLPKGNLATNQTVEISLIAPNPHWYGKSATFDKQAGQSTITVMNNGDAGYTPCTLILDANTAENQTTGKKMFAVSGKTVSGSTVDVSDSGVSATLNGTNIIGRFSIDSEFWGLVPGKNVLSGVSSITFKPRWDGI